MCDFIGRSKTAMESSRFVPITSAEHAMSVVLALRCKNRSVAEEVPPGSGRHVHDGHEAREAMQLVDAAGFNFSRQYTQYFRWRTAVRDKRVDCIRGHRSHETIFCRMVVSASDYC